MELSDKQDSVLREMVELLSKLPPPPEMDIIHDLNKQCDDTYLDCGCCISIKDQIKTNTGVVMAFDPICSKCSKGLKKTSPLVCVKCKKVVARMEPGVDKTTGFEFKGGRAYHIDSCPSCSPNTNHSEMRSIIIEKHIYEKERRK